MDCPVCGAENCMTLHEITISLRPGKDVYAKALEQAKEDFNQVQKEAQRINKRLRGIRFTVMGLSEILDLPMPEEYAFPKTNRIVHGQSQQPTPSGGHQRGR